jgi:hypothetical protein
MFELAKLNHLINILEGMDKKLDLLLQGTVTPEPKKQDVKVEPKITKPSLSSSPAPKADRELYKRKP